MPRSEPFDFTGRRVLVTGGSRGVGAAVSRHFGALGAHVIINYSRQDDAAKATLADVERAGGTGELARSNVGDVADWRRTLEEICAGGPIEYLVHCAALGSFKPTVDLTPPQWDLTMNVGARALLVAAQTVAPFMTAPGSAIVSVSSLGGQRVVPAYGAIGVSKAALEGLTRYLAVELAPRGIRVNAVSAGLIEDSPISTHPDAAELVAAARRRTPAGRLGTGEDIARVVAFLCSPQASWIVGQVIVADGGSSLLA